MFERQCPKCGSIITYKSKYTFITANKNNTNCFNCRKPSFGRQMDGINNPMFGKKMSSESIKKREDTKSKRNYPVYQSKEFKDKLSNISKGKNNPMFGKTFFQIWIEKYGVDIANQKMIEYKIKQSQNASRHMLGKPASKKSGNGWSGWYNGHFFRSLRELGYIYYELELKLIDWKSAENIRIPYIHYTGNNRTYSPDFLVGNKLIEIKPEKLINTPLIKLKTEAAIKYCKENNLEFEITDYKIIEIEDLDKLIENGQVILTDKTKVKYDKFFSK